MLAVKCRAGTRKHHTLDAGLWVQMIPRLTPLIIADCEVWWPNNDPGALSDELGSLSIRL